MIGRSTGGRGAVPAANVLIAVEIADATRDWDLGPKATDYARAHVPNYWVVDLLEQVTHVHTGPDADGYRSIKSVPFDHPLALPEIDRSIVLS